jgi:hypothetical protein
MSGVYVRVVLPDDEMTNGTAGLIETLGVAGLILVRANALDGGAVVDIPAQDVIEALKLRRGLEAWHVDATLVHADRR